jgi:hypothetical protein
MAVLLAAHDAGVEGVGGGPGESGVWGALGVVLVVGARGGGACTLSTLLTTAPVPATPPPHREAQAGQHRTAAGQPSGQGVSRVARCVTRRWTRTRMAGWLDVYRICSPCCRVTCPTLHPT